MKAQAEKPQENKSHSQVNTVTQKQSDHESSFQFEDNQPESVEQQTLQRVANESPQVKNTTQLQEKADNYTSQQQPIQLQKNNTGLPDHLKSGIENLSGYSMDDVKVHRNSSKPAQLQAHAYAQGTDIHLAPGQEKHLPHEAWHVVQQKQGRVKPTIQLKKGVSVNDDAGLEKEADVMGEKALKNEYASTNSKKNLNQNSIENSKEHSSVQRVVDLFQLFVDDSLSSKKSSQIGKEMNSEFHDLAFQLMKNDEKGDWKLGFRDTENGHPIQARLMVGPNWITAARTISKRVRQNGGNNQIINLLKDWAGDHEEEGRDFANWEEAIEAAQVALEGEGCSFGKGLLILFIILLIIITMGGAGFLMAANNRYEVSDLRGTASIARRPLEPLMPVQDIGRIQGLEGNSHVRALQHLTSQLPLEEFLDGNPEIETLVPDVARLRDIEGNLEEIAPQLEALAPQLESLRPMLEELDPNALENPSNVGLYHEHVFLGHIPDQTPSEDSQPLVDQGKKSPLTPTDIGAMDDGVRPDKQELMHTYAKPTAHYNRELMEEAALAVAGNFGKYKGLTHNCQDYADAVVTAYKELGGREVVPTYKSQVLMYLTDLIIQYGGGILDANVDEAVTSELSGLQGSKPPSTCAVKVSNKLGISSETFGGAIDAVLAQKIPIGSTGILLPLDTILCKPDGLDTVLDYASSSLDKEISIHEEGRATLREVLCTKKGKQDETVLHGIIFEIARMKGGSQILGKIPGFIKEDELATNKLMTDLTNRLANNLMQKLNLRGLCK